LNAKEKFLKEIRITSVNIHMIKKSNKFIAVMEKVVVVGEKNKSAITFF
jgi:hypothetical protein